MAVAGPIEALVGVTVLGAFAVFLAPDDWAAELATAVSLVPVAIALWMYSVFDGTGNALTGGVPAFESSIGWIALGRYEVAWHVGLDGISMPLLLLTTVLTTLALVSSWTPIDERQSQFYGLMLLLEASLIGVFTALDFILWLVFWEFVLIPMYFLIGVWGGPRRKYAAIKFFVYTNVATLVMFIGFMTLVFALGVDTVSTFDLPEIAQALRTGGSLEPFFGIAPADLRLVAFVLMFAGFAVKVPVFPVHTWLPDAHVEAPTPVSVMLAGVLLKMGTYALLRFNFTMLQETAIVNAEFIVAFGVFSVIYGAMLALAQQDLKRIVAYSSISSMGYVILGLIAFTPHGLGGATFQMVSHGLISGLMFMVVGVIYNETHTRMVGDISGIADRMPWTVGVFVAAAFGYMGLPFMAGFAGEYLIFQGVFHSAEIPMAPLVIAVAMFGIVIVAGYLLWAMQRTLFGEYSLATDYEVSRAPLQDVAPLVVLLGLVIALGVDPMLVYDIIQDATVPLLPPDWLAVPLDWPAAAVEGGVGAWR